MSVPHQMAWDENRSGQPDARNLISVPVGGAFYQATRNALPWTEYGSHDDESMAVPSTVCEIC